MAEENDICEARLISYAHRHAEESLVGGADGGAPRRLCLEGRPGRSADRGAARVEREAGGRPGREKPAAAPAEKEPAAMESIGWATITDDGTITLDLQATGPNAVGEGRLVYPKDHAQYKEIAAHVGAIKPGERKPVAPFKD
jgi:hypothetical protein